MPAVGGFLHRGFAPVFLSPRSLHPCDWESVGPKITFLRQKRSPKCIFVSSYVKMSEFLKKKYFWITLPSELINLCQRELVDTINPALQAKLPKTCDIGKSERSRPNRGDAFPVTLKLWLEEGNSQFCQSFTSQKIAIAEKWWLLRFSFAAETAENWVMFCPTFLSVKKSLCDLVKAD